MPDTAETLIFVYNADSGMLNTLKDITHKIVSPDTYECNLCAITHGNFRMHGEWKAFIDALDKPVRFLHKNEAEEKYAIRDHLPAVYLETDKGIVQCLDADAINQCGTIEELKLLLRECI